MSSLTHGLAACAGLLVLALLIGRRDTPMLGWAFFGAIAATTLWTSIVAWAGLGSPRAVLLMSPAETVRNAAWIGMIVSMLARSWNLGERDSFALFVAVVLGFVFTALLLVDFAPWLGWTSQPAQELPGVNAYFVFGRLITAIGGLVLIHNLFLNATPQSRWGLRMLCIGLTGLFGYDLHYYSVALLQGSQSPDLFAGRGLLTAISLGVLAWAAYRNQRWTFELQVSRQVVFHSLSLVAIGLYLVLMSALAYGARALGGNYGGVLQVGILLIMLTALVLVFVSGRFRAWAKVKIAKHFFARKYDYRDEWLRFIATLSGTQAGNVTTLEARVIKAVCDIVDSPGGSLWQPDEAGDFSTSARWNHRTAVAGVEAADGAFITFLSGRGRIVDFTEMRDGSGDYDGQAIPAWAAQDNRAWLAVPLIHLDRLTGFLVIEHPRAARSLNWEDFDLLRTAGRQAASYIAEGVSQRALVESRQFDDFNRRFAFIMHDIKNLVSQLSLVVRNAERFGDNPEFQKDMRLTLADSVGKLNDLLARLQQHNTAKPDVAPVDIARTLQNVVNDKARTYEFLTLSCDGHEMIVRGDASRLEQVFTHLIQNAIDATPSGPVHVRVGADGEDVIVTVDDKGCGMSEDFVRNELFKPFRSTKTGGYGIGAYEARQIVRSSGGRLEVRSVQGQGSSFTIRLPRFQEGHAAAAE
jgi:putative PEP-CTERM system histidine kinase